MRTFDKLVNSIIENNVADDIVKKCYNILLKNSKKELSGGNCGQVSYAISRFILDKFNTNSKIGVLTNVEDETDLLNEPDIYHIYTVFNNKKYDETGKINNNYLLNLALDQYGNYKPVEFVFNFPSEADKLLKIISRETNYNENWNYFYDILKSHYENL